MNPGDRELIMSIDIDRAIGAAAEFQDIVAAIDQAPHLATTLGALALDEVRRGVVTGEGATTRGRVHFSRTIDATDAAMCEMILIAAGGEAGKPVTREEAEILFDIHEAGLEREDNGHFDDLFVKAIAHHVLSAAGHVVPPRATALARKTAIADWATPEEFEAIDREIAGWLDQHVRSNRRAGGPLDTIAAFLVGAGISAIPMTTSLAALIDFAA
jgi:hypothetical protein